MKGFITTIQRMSIHDGPGIRSTVFLKGCNLRCKWCHNPETWSSRKQLQYLPDKCIGCLTCASVCASGAITCINNPISIDRNLCTSCGKCTEACPSGALSWVGKEIDSSEVIESVLQDLIFYQESGGGVTLSGGEPLLQKAFALEILKECRNRGVHTAIESNLLTETSTIREFLPWVDLWMCDLKMADSKLHREWTGQPNETILQNLRLLSEQNVPLVVRTPVIPDVNDSEESIEQLCQILEQLPHPPAYELLGFHSLGFGKFKSLGMRNPMEKSGFMDKNKLKKLRDILLKHILEPQNQELHED